jgi:membrane protein YqaA with SNARE-associated domain
MNPPTSRTSEPVPDLPASRVRNISRVRLSIVLFELFFIAALTAVWFGCPGVRSSRNLWVLFFYNFPSQFLIAPVPHEPALLYFGKFYAPALVTLFAISGTLCTELLNYTCFQFFADLQALQKIWENRWVRFTVQLFKKAPFAALWIAGFTPIPFYPLRFLVVLARYPVWKYLLAVLLSRTPRFYIIAWAGNSIHISDLMLGIFFFFVTILLNIPVVMKLWNNRKEKRASDLKKAQENRI